MYVENKSDPLVQQYQTSLERLTRQVQTSTEIAQEIAAALALDDLFRRVVNLVQEQFNYYHVHIYTLERNGLIVQEGTGEVGRELKEADYTIALTTKRSLVARAARSGNPVLIPDVSQEPTWLPNPFLGQTQSELAVPIKLGDVVLGVLDVQSERIGGLSEEDQLLLVGLCGQIAVAINQRQIEAKRRQAEETLQRQNAYLAALHETALDLLSHLDLTNLLETLIIRAGQLLGAPNGFIYLKQLRKQYLKQEAPKEIRLEVAVGDYQNQIGERLKIGEGLAGKVWQTGQPLVANDYSAWSKLLSSLEKNVLRATVGVPLTQKAKFGTTEPQVSGVIGLAYDTLSDQTFGQQEVELLSRFAQLASIALDNARLYAAAQEARATAEAATRTKSEFLANMSHELRTPLNGILGYTQILKREKSLTDQQRESLNIIQYSGDHLLTLINDILDLSKIEAGKMELNLTNFNLPIFLASMAELIHIRAEQNQTLFNYQPFDFRQNKILDHLPVGVRGDQKRLRQVLINLLGNAVKFAQNETVTLKVGPVEAEATESSPSEMKNRVAKIRFQVEDTGSGIPPEQLDAIFQPFRQMGDQQHQTEGTGLGLAISRNLVRLMGGELKVKSQVGVGSIFWFDVELPEVVEWIDPASKNTQTIIGYQGRKRKILVVDDKWENRALIIALLSPLGFETLEAANGSDGLEKAVSFKPDVILIDLVMPILDGFEMTRRIRQSSSFRDTILIATSASVFDKNQQASLDVGCNAFIPKPIQTDLLFEMLQRYLGLEWVYEEITAPTSPVPDKALTSAPIVPPTKDEIRILFNLAMMGDIQAIQKEVDKLEHLNEVWEPFAAKIRHLAKGFQIKKICAFLEPYLE